MANISEKKTSIKCSLVLTSILSLRSATLVLEFLAELLIQKTGRDGPWCTLLDFGGAISFTISLSVMEFPAAPGSVVALDNE